MNEPFRATTTLRCTPEHAFHTFTTKVDLWWPRSHRRFDRSSFSFEARAGGRLIERGPDGATMTFGEVLSCDPPNEIRLAWHPGKVSLPTEVTITFRQDGELTVVQVVHSEGDSALGNRWDEKVALFSGGWAAIFAALEECVRPSEHDRANKQGST